MTGYRRGVRRPPPLPPLIQQKLTKTGYTRGATTKEIFQNRVTRNNTVLIPWEFWDDCKEPDDGSDGYEKGFIVLVEPSWYFTTDGAADVLAAEGIQLGLNALLLYRKRPDWVLHFVDRGGLLPDGTVQQAAMSRTAPLGGTYMARVHATVAAEDGDMVVRGYNTTGRRGAGIRVYEYASTASINATRLQLEALFWSCEDAHDAAVAGGMAPDDAKRRKAVIVADAAASGLLDFERLRVQRMVDDANFTMCPLCLLRVSATDFMRRSEQAVGRETYDLTTTEVSLFHVDELRVGVLQHKPYNLGWGHHFCNVVTKDTGIDGTVTWMRGVVDRQPDP
ncbi:MAG: BstXI family restriction endonuclease [Candidatus Nanopelagicales bacterium]